jgi:hypothetical protein
LDYALCYGLWIVVLALAFWAFWAWRTTIEMLVDFYFRESDAFAAIYTASTLIAGLLLLIAIMASEAYLRGSLDRPYGETEPYFGLRRLRQRFGRILVPLLLTTVLAFGVQQWAVRQFLSQSGSGDLTGLTRRRGTGGSSPGDPIIVVPGQPSS